MFRPSPTTLARSRTALAAAVVAAAGLGVAAPAGAAVPPISFAQPVYYPTGQMFDSPSADDDGTATGDFLGNGRQDVVSVDQWEGDSVVIQYNEGDGVFSSPGQAITLPGVGVENVVTGVFTSSGRTDIVVLTENGFYFVRNDGGGAFTVGPFNELQQAPFQDTAVAADFNGDGKLDLAIKTPEGIQVEFGNGNGTFTTGPLTTIPGSTGVGIASIATANLTGSGTPDLLAADGGSQEVYALKGNGNGTFTEIAAELVPWVPTSVQPIQDTPGGLDSTVALGEFGPFGSTAALLANNGEGGFEPAKTYNGGLNPIGLAAGDFNGDGWGDVVSSDTTGSELVVLAGDGNGDLVPEGSYPTGTFPQSPVVADFTGNGKQDIAVTTFCPGGGVFSAESCLAVLLNDSGS
jgi:hypothetical protein